MLLWFLCCHLLVVLVLLLVVLLALVQNVTTVANPCYSHPLEIQLDIPLERFSSRSCSTTPNTDHATSTVL